MNTTFDRTMNSPTAIEVFEAHALPHLNDLFRAAQHLLQDHAQAEDIVQEAYYQAWKSFHRFQPGTNCRTWLFRILFQVLQHHQSAGLKFTWMTDITEASSEAFVYEPPVPQHLTNEEVLCALNCVPLQFRAVLLLADVGDFSYTEITEVLDIPTGTVMSRLSRGRNLLRCSLAGLAESYGIRQTKLQRGVRQAA